MNRAILSGRLTRDPEVRYNQGLNGGFAIAKMTLAVDRPKKKDQEEKATDFIDLVAFGKRAEFLERYGFKGQRIAVSGSIRVDKYEIQGEKKTRTEVYIDDVDIIDWPDRPQDRINEEAFVF